MQGIPRGEENKQQGTEVDWQVLKEYNKEDVKQHIGEFSKRSVKNMGKKASREQNEKSGSLEKSMRQLCV